MKINNLTLFKCFPLFFFNFFILLKCQITFSDQVPFVYYQQNIQLYKLNDHTLQGQSTIDYSSKSFKNIPTVIVGIDFYNNFWNVPDGVNFNISSSQVTQNGCIIQASRLENSNLVGISASALVIDISQYPFFYVTNIEKNNIQFTNFEYSEYFSFSSQLQNQGQKNVSVVLTGWKSSYDYSNKFFALTVEATNITDSGYTIKISTANQAQTIINVYFTVLEYIQNPLSIYGIVSQYDTLYKQQTIIKCFYTTSCQNQQRYFPVKFDVFMQVQKTSYTDFFVSINQFYFNTENSSQDLRISIENQSFSSNTIQYSYYIWDGAKCQGTTSTALQFYKKTCPQGQYLSTNGNDCLTTCLIYLQNNQICLDCSSGQYFLQDQNICSTTQPTGYFCSTQDPKYTFQVCQICNIPNCKECNSAFQCTLCTDSYYLFNGKCFQDQPPNTYCDPQKLICSKCLDNNCLTCSDPSQTSSQCLKCDDKKTQILYQNKCYTQDSPPSNTFCDWKILKCIQCTDVSCLSCSDPTQPSSKCLSCDQSQKLILYEDKCFSQSQPPPNTFCDWNKLTCSKCSDTSCLSCSDPITSPQVCLSCDESLKQILYQCKCYSQSNPPPNTFCDWIQLKCSQCGDKNCLTCKETIQECLQCIDSQSQILYQGKCYTQSSPPKNTFCDWKQMKCTQCADSNCLTCSDPNLPEQQCLQCADSQNQILYEGQCYIQSSPPKNTFCDWKQMKCTQCADSNCLTCSDPSIFPQVCISCDQSKQKLAFFQGKCFTQNSRPDNTFCDWDNLKCFQCLDNNCLSCSNPSEPPQICKSCDITKQQILYEGKCFSQSNPPSNTFCDWSNQQCFKCKDNDCLACTDPSQSPQQCLSCIDSKNSILYQGKCYTQNNPPTNTFCNWSKLKCSQCNNSSCQTCSDPNYPPQICLSCDLSKNKITFQGKCYCGIGLYLDQNNNCSQKCAQGCLLCLNSYSCDKYSDNEVYSGNKCDYSCSQCTIPNKNYGCTECSSKTRQLEKITGSCFCKDGYTNVGIPDCQDDNALKPQQQIQTASDGVLQAVFILYLPQLFINIHPFTDYFIFQMQSLGNLYFVNQNQTEIFHQKQIQKMQNL
ncbi:hypothetical protein TTHERM_00274430 (macronuclear) [Tetrahymena thermophila SB210]|uniref:H-type lectin domain protein n=1 Tax=Tetrahymena thermophila (strain SB210) TaxID=312017 RepID=I7MJ24_TETTS|nr:hypothetical protein TTHERM_00274430 [Tetrahymena thermophila SB210]EAR95738.1 hypothetical protein TTHERM_00274430 [Tetrahymena thermophila SB210]|eukprot:XP_001015983.1 hypothetical protein TTHERM_00274430 [Tetrahymena thermophila SB210]